MLVGVTIFEGGILTTSEVGVLILELTFGALIITFPSCGDIGRILRLGEVGDIVFAGVGERVGILFSLDKFSGATKVLLESVESHSSVLCISTSLTKGPGSKVVWAPLRRLRLSEE